MEATACSLLIAFLTGLAFLYRLPRQLRYPPTLPKTRPSLSTKPDASTDSDPQQSSPIPLTVTKEPDFPANWLTGKQLFDLERRALFSKQWIPLSHTAHFLTPGSYQTLSIANYSLILVRGKDSVIRGFHNVCRHRAYPVTSREFGCSTVLRCRYHGWSYNAKGELVSAPHFGDVEGFKRAENGLFEVRIAVDGKSGVVWGCLDVGSNEGGLVGVEEMRVKAGCTWIGGAVLEGKVNWKIGLSKTRLRTLLGLDDLQQPPSFIQRLLSLTPFQQRPQPSSIQLFPNTFLYTVPGSECWLSIRFLPISENRTAIRYDLYSYQDANDQTVQNLLVSLEENVKRVVGDLEAEYQEAITGDAGPIMPNLAAETAEIQLHILSLLRAHTKLEKAQGAEIYPARREPRTNSQYEQAEQLCRELTSGDCGGSGGDGGMGAGGSLAW
ncbi:Rieske [2Fe-2S] iron-sulfur domain-containing protein [Aspergillus granulosus]|uniref:Rieske [2Fe-2S] iron-sulfur domain-containing protein n=1 Tax=Aspergillus granulosus TaxID=176169 RepID=A0ABR4H8M5_9EURO